MKCVALSFLIGGMIFMLIPTFARSAHDRARLAMVFHLVLEGCPKTELFTAMMMFPNGTRQDDDS